MLCPSCHADVPAGQRFCGACGASLDAASDATRASDAATRLAEPPAGIGADAAPASGWLGSSGSIDHGRFGPGAVLDGRYRVIGLLGRGGMGEVYRADDLRLGQPVALKFLPVSLAGDPHRLAQLHNEVRTARQVSQASVCRVYDVGDSGGQLFLTMEYVDGEDLAASLRRVGRFPEDKGLDIARQICAGLAAAHDRGVIHRDLKPANIMIDAAGRVRIMDFGLAAAGAVDDVRAGTPAYMAPEQLAGREVTARSDIYALGLVLYELFTGRRAFMAASIAELTEQQAAGALTPPTELVKGLDPAIERAILRCLEPDPSRRPSSVLAVSAALPGGDPLAAALAAGETPSPEMVAAAGGDRATITPRAGVAWLVTVAVLAIVVTALADRVSMVSRIPALKRPDVLADRADALRQSLGYTDPVVDQMSGFGYDGEYLAWASAHGAGAARWPGLAADRPAAMRFWDRTSPDVLAPVDFAMPAGPDDPPLAVAGMTRIELDVTGRLLSFVAVPRQIDPDVALPAPTVDWPAIMTAAGLTPSAFTEIAPGRTPPTFADARHAWRGPLPDTGVTVTIEAASYRGRPVYFEVVGPWTSASREPGAARPNDGNGPVLVVLVVLLLVVAALLTRRNIESGRADRRGAFRLAAFTVLLSMGAWLLQPHVRNLAIERQRLFTTLGLSLFLGGALYVVYLAIEPIVRRSWPRTLVSWSRLLAGRVRDAAVGRDLLVGIGCGLLFTLCDRADHVLPVLAGLAEPIPLQPPSAVLMGLRPLVAALSGCVSAGLQEGLFTTLEIALLRLFVQRMAPRLGLARLSVDGLTSVLAALAVTTAVVIDDTGSASHLWMPLLTGGIGLAVVLFLVMRVGVLAAIFAFTVNVMTNRVPLTFDGSRFYAGAGWAVLAGMFAVAWVGLRWARGTMGSGLVS